MDTPVTLLFTPGEIIAPGTALKVRCCRPIQPQSAESVVTYQNQQRIHTAVSTEDNATVINVLAENLKPGHYKLSGIGFVLFDDQSEVRDLGNLITISRADRAHTLGVTGAGVNVAVFESGPRTMAANLPIRGRYLANPPLILNDADEHGRLVCGIISNTEPGQPHGIAPDCNLFSANSSSNDALRWAATTRENPRSIDRELPHITANGELVAAVGVALSGTSFAAPAVAGAVALIQQANSDLRKLPAACRAILLASADRNISGSTWWQDVQVPRDASDGAGALNAEAAVLVVQSRASKDGPPRKRAWDGGLWWGGNFGPNAVSSFRYRIQVPTATTTGRFTVKVAFTWDSFIPFNATGAVVPHMSFLWWNFDLLVFDDRGVQVANSSSFDNNYEIVEFTSLPNQEYAIAIRLTRDVPPAGRPMANVGIAWIVTEI
ncbi:subtilisin-like protein [Zopfia rhizophila CBS 207.26]|uniref:Subtilisin-like protein n=1 Tax=Zopfia rhizophila CBS 207.26 TaxID=1314779 RepID=A0A6A6ELQ2_9PEZI|nr:subtilisin-like protein [Zopfia rhizophila CBS 207.26]